MKQNFYVHSHYNYVLTYVLKRTTIIMYVVAKVVEYTVYTYIYIQIIIGVKMSLLKNSLISNKQIIIFTKNGECSKFQGVQWLNC